jgi:diguanylate cyclase (GGDEF)-like protein/PAS domain S-box-containing protein
MHLPIFLKHSLKSRVTLFTLAIILSCIWSLAFYGREILRETVQRSLGEQQSLNASFIAAGVNHELDDRLKALEAIAGIITPAILGNATALQAALDDRPVFQSLFAGRTFTAKLDGIATASAALRADGIDAGLLDANCIAAAFEGAAAIGRPVVGKKTLAPMVVMAVPIRDARGKVIGVLGGLSDLSKSNFLEKATGNTSRKAGGYLLIAPQHRLIVMADDKNRIMETLPAPGINPAIDRLIRGAWGGGLVVNPRGAEVLASSEWIPLADWFVVLTLPADQAFAPFHAARRSMLLASIFLSLLAAGLTWLMLRSQLAPMLTAARTLAAHSKADQFLQPLAISRPDEIGELIAGFNRLLEALRQRQEALTLSEERFRCLSEMSADFYWESNSEHQLTQRTESRREIDESVFRHLSSLGLRRWEMPSVLPDEAGWQAHREILDAHLPFRHFEIARLRDNGSVHHVAISGDPLFDGAGQFKGYRGVGADITERKQIELALVASKVRLNAVLDGVQSAVVTITDHGLVESFNQSAVQMFGYSPDEVVGNNIRMLMPAPYRQEHDGYLDNFKRTGIKKVIGRRREVMGQRKDGAIFPIELGVFETSLNEHKFFIGSISDISFRKQAEVELRIAATAFESQQGMLITDANGVILRVNQAFTEINGYTSAEAVGQTPRLLKSDRQGPDFYRAMWQAIERTGGWQGEIWDRRKSGEVYPKWLTITAVKDEDGVITHYVGTHLDITERKQAEERVRHLAFYDTLTDLPNRRLLSDRLKQGMAASKRSAHHGALMFLDMDNFKSLNDTHGHAFGDLLLIEAADRLKRCVRQVDTVARFGGDEFVVLLSHLHADRSISACRAKTIAEKISASLSEPYLLTIMRDGKAALTVEHCCTVSIGVELFAGDDASEDELLKRADAAMYQAKQSGKNSIRIELAVA